jgi:GTPase SAR1 family protein
MSTPPEASSAARVTTIGVVGPSGVGKSSIANSLAHCLLQADVVGEDAYHATQLPPGHSYAKRDPVSETPANVVWPRLLEDVRARKQRLQTLCDADGRVRWSAAPLLSEAQS